MYATRFGPETTKAENTAEKQGFCHKRFTTRCGLSPCVVRRIKCSSGDWINLLELCARPIQFVLFVICTVFEVFWKTLMAPRESNFTYVGC